MFTQEDKYFMSNNMKIIVGSIESKISEPFFKDYKNAAISQISKYIEEINKFEKSGFNRETKYPHKNHVVKFIECSFKTIINEMKINDHLEVLDVFDGLQHSFKIYASGGLRELFIRQANESWYPKIILNSILTPNDIDKLSPDITIYRGCDINELTNGNIGQSWTLSLSVAKEFAFEHYRHQSWFNPSSRTVLTANIAKKNIFFYSEEYGESEVAVNTKQLKNLKVYEKVNLLASQA
ncbi:hypothetical protein [Providencia sp. PROV196]|uniref:hypothetical protein n=1 Tax=Providencia sp. PROV196 TaxID=2949897 RepID=UPI00234B0872|nr:hypothetical protein [Providencia sp. PROV196]